MLAVRRLHKPPHAPGHGVAMVIEDVEIHPRPERPAVLVPEPPRHRRHIHPGFNAARGEQMPETVIAQRRQAHPPASRLQGAADVWHRQEPVIPIRQGAEPLKDVGCLGKDRDGPGRAALGNAGRHDDPVLKDIGPGQPLIPVQFRVGVPPLKKGGRPGAFASIPMPFLRALEFAAAYGFDPEELRGLPARSFVARNRDRGGEPRGKIKP